MIVNKFLAAETADNKFTVWLLELRKEFKTIQNWRWVTSSIKPGKHPEVCVSQPGFAVPPDSVPDGIGNNRVDTPPISYPLAVLRMIVRSITGKVVRLDTQLDSIYTGFPDGVKLGVIAFKRSFPFKRISSSYK